METTNESLQEKNLQLVLETIRKEHRRTQMVFGVSIIIMALVLIATVPAVISMEIAALSAKRDMNIHGGTVYTNMPDLMQTTSTTSREGVPMP